MQSRQKKLTKKPSIKASRQRTWEILLLQRNKKYPLKSAEIKKAAKKILNALDCSKLPKETSSLSILFTTDREIHRLNKEFRGKDKPTDVLSFSLTEGMNGIPSHSLGDLVISLDTAAVQAKKYRVTFDQEILRLIVHGILHLMGYDHEKVAKSVAAKMRRIEEKIYFSMASELSLSSKRSSRS
jgi:probable rRNA maturation factor